MFGITMPGHNAIRSTKHKYRSALYIISAFSLIASPTFAGTTTYKYDDLGRLTLVSPSASSYSVYTYDLADNRTKMRTGGNSAPTCPSFTVSVSQPNLNPITLAVPLGQGCSDADGDTVVVSAPSAPYYVTVGPSQSIPVPYQATDGIATTNVTITVCWAPC
jgi:hypothetical protein